MAMIISKTIDVNGIRMHVTEGGAAPVRAFQSGKAPVFLLSLKAGGTGGVGASTDLDAPYCMGRKQ